jgi:hypothetical protein
MYLNAYVPKLTSEAGVAGFLRGHLGHRFASTKYAGQMTDAFVVAPKPSSRATSATAAYSARHLAGLRQSHR